MWLNTMAALTSWCAARSFSPVRTTRSSMLPLTCRLPVAQRVRVRQRG